MLTPVNKLMVSTLEGLFFLSPDDIIRLEASSNYTHIFFTNRKPLLLSRVLKDFTGILEPLGFLRTHRSHLVNRQHISSIDAGGHIIMYDASRAEISRRKKSEVLKCLRYVKDRKSVV